MKMKWININNKFYQCPFCGAVQFNMIKAEFPRL